MDSPPRGEASQLPSNPPTRPSDHTRKPSLLPAFEPLSSSPFPRPQSAKRKFGEDSPSFPKQQLKYYPTPVPTSSTGIITSSSPQHARPTLQRTVSTLSERVPLGAVPTVDLPANGEVVRMGRSSNSSDYQLSANRLISRVHVQAAYHAPSAVYPKGFVQIECLGWNGAKIHCRGRAYELTKGACYVSDNPEAEIMLDVQDTRVIIAWPAAEEKSAWDDSEIEDDHDQWNRDGSLTPTPSHRPAQDHFASSPPIIPRSPISQSPARQLSFTAPSPPQPVQVYEDANSDEQANETLQPEETFVRPSPSCSATAKNSKSRRSDILASFQADTSFQSDDFSDGDEENDPVVHSFGPFGENLLPRMASFSATTSRPSARSRRPLITSQSPQQASITEPAARRINESPIKNHVINQLAFSRLHSIPLSVIHSHLPAELKACASEGAEGEAQTTGQASTSRLSADELKKIMDGIPCIGEINRSGKDAAGKPLENQFYYVPEMDANVVRREAVTGGLGGTGLRSTRKVHKQYYWKKPRH
ncbi:hypothetical protein GQ43DRAFT_494369 [Delitschia confertaspora ATCC 74209]|uniref:FHA domain-containing protein n=1 Tax=Delitschia confertaspora ATCC 74209 TaxID=1513339 RepID=A0A9P4JF60_9PLEO|nr:hypothetical protein GQ43DRAFT_494369 [Delitschia confertaspora ATCC 74209]